MIEGDEKAGKREREEGRERARERKNKRMWWNS
jgi:hypothetical protein